MSKKPYKPKKKRYNDLRTLSREMTEAKVKHTFNGWKIETRVEKFTMVDSQLLTIQL